MNLPGSLVIPIIGDGAIAGPIADGRLLPVLILDTSQRTDMAELIRVHAHLPPGDVLSQWAASRDSADLVMLHLTFVRPMDVELVLLFSMERQAILVEGILSGGGVYLQSGVVGDRLMNTMDAPRVLAEVPELGFRDQWDELLLNRMTVVVSQRLGVSRRKAGPTAEAVIAQMRKLARFRMAVRTTSPNSRDDGDEPAPPT